jgi:hypothetical protein
MGPLDLTDLAMILAWDLSQLVVLSCHPESLTRTLFSGTMASFAVGFATLMMVAYRRSRTGHT